jgi:hypothetical protein
MQTVDNRSLVLFLSGLAAAGAAVVIAVSCSDQPRNKCTAGRGQFNAVYLSPSGSMTGDCALPGETLGVEAYNPPNSDRTNADLKSGSIAIKAASLVAANDSHAGFEDMDPTHNINSIGNFTTSEPGADDYCNVPTLNPSEVNVPFIPRVPPMPILDAGPDGPDATPEVPPVNGIDIKYAWSNVKVKVTPAFNGLALAADLTLTTQTISEETLEAGTGPAMCTATYRVVGLFNPNQIPCEKVVDEDAGTTGPDFCQCLPYADPENGRPTGSGFAADLFAGQPGDPNQACEKGDAQRNALEAQSKVTCHSTLHMCVLKAELP